MNELAKNIALGTAAVATVALATYAGSLLWGGNETVKSTPAKKPTTSKKKPVSRLDVHLSMLQTDNFPRASSNLAPLSPHEAVTFNWPDRVRDASNPLNIAVLVTVPSIDEIPIGGLYLVAPTRYGNVTLYLPCDGYGKTYLSVPEQLEAVAPRYYESINDIDFMKIVKWIKNADMISEIIGS